MSEQEIQDTSGSDQPAVKFVQLPWNSDIHGPRDMSDDEEDAHPRLREEEESMEQEDFRMHPTRYPGFHTFQRNSERRRSPESPVHIEGIPYRRHHLTGEQRSYSEKSWPAKDRGYDSELRRSKTVSAADHFDLRTGARPSYDPLVLGTDGEQREVDHEHAVMAQVRRHYWGG